MKNIEQVKERLEKLILSTPTKAGEMGFVEFLTEIETGRKKDKKGGRYEGVDKKPSPCILLPYRAWLVRATGGSDWNLLVEQTMEGNCQFSKSCSCAQSVCMSKVKRESSIGAMLGKDPCD